MANESVLVDDLKGFVQGAIRLLHGVAKGGGDGATAVAAEGAKERADDAPGGYTNRCHYCYFVIHISPCGQIEWIPVSFVGRRTGSLNQ